MQPEELTYKDALFYDCSWGRIVFVMGMRHDDHKLHFFVGIGQALNDAIDVNNTIAHGFDLPTEAGIAIFFGEWE